MSDVEARLTALEREVADLREAVHGTSAGGEETPPTGGTASSPAPSEDDRFWMLAEMRRRHPEGAVGFTGHVRLPGGEAQWQWGRTTDALLAQDWEDAGPALAALGHPVRLHLLRLVLTGTTTTSALTEDEGLGTSGQLHHHLRALVSAGWLASAGRGRYEVPPQRVVPLLVVLSATLPA